MCRELSRPTEAPHPKDETVTLTIDGRKLEAPAGASLLAVARDAGIEVPTLCDHPVVEPVGACRLCMVEVTHPDWAGWTGLVAACLYPAASGLVVQTRSESVRAARREVLSVLAARCPTSPTIRALVARHGAGSPAAIRADSCIMCGLCLRVCEAWATSPITTHGDGSLGTAVGPFVEPAGCVGCGACASVCPTTHIAARRTADHYEIWGHRFETPICVVDESRCVGCGACEEACPFSVARVALALGPGGGRIARIPAASCRGCGACLGACPGGAITQPGGERCARLAPSARLAVYACGRAGLAREAREGIDAHELFCAGRVSVPLLLAELAAGRDGVLVLGRHEESCRLRGAEDPARERVARAAELAELCGLGDGRVRFVEPDPTLAGPPRAAAELAAALAARPLAPPRAAVPRPVREDLDETLALLPALAARGAGSDARAYLARRGLPPAVPGAPALSAGILPYLELAAGSMLRPFDVSTTLHAALAVLSRLGIAGAGIAIAEPGATAAALRAASVRYVLDPREVAPLRAQGLDAQLLPDLLRAPPGAAGHPVGVACGAGESLLSALGMRAIDVGPDPLADLPGFALGPEDRRRAEAYLARAEGAGAAALLVTSPAALVRWAIVTRHGTWRSSRIAAFLPHELAHRCWSDLPFAQPAAFRPAARSLEVRP